MAVAENEKDKCGGKVNKCWDVMLPEFNDWSRIFVGNFALNNKLTFYITVINLLFPISTTQ
jgi:hypothetical protein